jgi:hypothetical protein
MVMNDNTSLPEWSYEATQRLALSRIQNNKRDERREIFAQILAGKPFAEPGARDATLQRVASWLAFFCCDGDPEALADLLIPSLEAMEEASPTDFISYEDAFAKVIRAQNDARDKERIKREAEARMLAAITGAKSAPKADTSAAFQSLFGKKIPDPSPSGAAPVATPEGNGSDQVPSEAVGSGVTPGGSGPAVVPGGEPPGRLVLGAFRVNPFAPRSKGAGVFGGK